MLLLLTTVATLVLQPYHGPALAGNVPGNATFALRIGGHPGAHVKVASRGLPSGWIASFCTSRVCSPFRVEIVLPPSGVESIEFQVIRNDEGARRPRTVSVADDRGLRAAIAYRRGLPPTPNPH